MLLELSILKLEQVKHVIDQKQKHAAWRLNYLQELLALDILYLWA